MKMSLNKLTLTLGIIALSAVSFGQKTNITTAALEYRNTLKPKLYAEQDIEAAKKSAQKCKTLIDEASVHPDTKDDQKMHWYKGEIYIALSVLAEMDTTYIDMSPDEAFDIALHSYAIGAKGAKKSYRESVKIAVEEKVFFASLGADMAIKSEKYAEAGEAFEAMAALNNTLSILDTGNIYNAGIMYENAQDFKSAVVMYDQLAAVSYRGSKGAVLAANAHKVLGNTSKAIEILTAARKSHPSDKDLLLGLVNANIEAGDAPGAEKALADAIATDPTNKLLHYNSGTIYINIGDEAKKAEKMDEANDAYGKAELALNEAIKIDPDYVDAQYQLGAHLFNWASQLKEQADFLQIGDPREKELKDKSAEKMSSAISALEKYIVHEPEDKGILRILYKAYHKKGNAEKATEYKKRLDAL